MQRGMLFLFGIFMTPLVLAQETESHPVRNFVILLVEVALIVTVILIINHNIIEKRRSSTISKQINRVFLVLLIFFSLFIRFRNNCTHHSELFLISSIIIFTLTLLFYLPLGEGINQLFLIFITFALVMTVLHAVDHAKHHDAVGECVEIKNQSFLNAPPLELPLLLLIIGFFTTTLIHFGYLKKIERWSK
jgi:hypothetical protein